MSSIFFLVSGNKAGKIKKISIGKNLSDITGFVDRGKRALSQSLTRAISDSDEFRGCDFS